MADSLAVPACPCPTHRPAHRPPQKQLAADGPRGGERTGPLRRGGRLPGRRTDCPTRVPRIVKNRTFRKHVAQTSLKTMNLEALFISDLKNHMISLFRPREHPRRRPVHRPARRPARRPMRPAHRPTLRPPLKQPATGYICLKCLTLGIIC